MLKNKIRETPLAWVGMGCLLVLGTVFSAAPVGAAEVAFGSWERPLRGYYVQSGGEFVQVEAPAYERGPLYPIEEGMIRVYRKSQSDANPPFELAAEWPAPAGAEKVWVILVQAKDGQLHGVVASDDADAFGPRHLRLMNVTPAPMVLRVGERDYEVPALSARVLETRPDRKYRVGYKLAYQVPGESWSLLKGSVLSLPPNYRGTLIAAVSEGFGVVKEGMGLHVLSVVEYVPTGR